MKRILSCLLVILILGSALCACAPQGENGGLVVVCTTFSLYDWTRAIVGAREGIEIILLADGGRDVHSYEPSIKDMATISECDLFIGVGGSSEEWLVDFFETSERVPRRTVLLMELLGEYLLAEPEVSRGPHSREDEEHSHGEYDEHVWLSPALAQKACQAIMEVLCVLDGAGAEDYLRGYEAYAEKLSALSAQCARIAAAAERKTLVFGDRYPFVYLFAECGLSAYAAFPGCSSESEASFETVLVLSSLETVNDKQNESYLARMSKNLEALATVLGIAK